MALSEFTTVKARRNGVLISTRVLFLGEAAVDIKGTQVAFIKACIADGIYLDNEVIEVDNSKLRLQSGTAVFFDFASGACGFGHVLPGVIVQLFKDISKKQRPKLHWYVRYQGEALPNPDYPFACRKKPW